MGTDSVRAAEAEAALLASLPEPQGVSALSGDDQPRGRDGSDSAFLRDAAKHFENQPTHGEDRAHWANVYNAMNCRRIADRLDAIEQKWATLPADAMLVLAALGNGESVPSALGVSEDTGVLEARVKELHRALKALGFAERSTLMNDEGRTCGSGYFITVQGERFRKAVRQAA